MKYFVTVNGKKYEVEVETDETVVTAEEKKAEPVAEEPVKVNKNIENLAGEAVNAPMPGKILDIRVSEGQSIKKGELILVLEAMKMENEIMAPRDGVVSGIAVNKGDNVNTGDKLVVLG